MQPSSSIPKTLPFMTPLVCPKCGAQAHLVRLEPNQRGGGEVRVFKCVECGRLVPQTVNG